MQPHKADLGHVDRGYKKIDISSAQGDILTHQRQPKTTPSSTGCNGDLEPKTLEAVMLILTTTWQELWGGDPTSHSVLFKSFSLHRVTHLILPQPWA